MSRGRDKARAAKEYDAKNPPKVDFVAGCPGCIQRMETGMGPAHYASPRCRSGKRPHCSCDTCF